MRLAITGTRGTLGTALVRRLEAAGHEVLHLNRPEYDITDPAAVNAAFESGEPDALIHPAAYTNVDGAESNPDDAYRVNGLGTRNLALACESAGIPILYVSTNMVFDGTKGSPYTEFDEPCPIGVYATSKRAGERYVEHLSSRFYIARTSWVYGKEGDSFIHKIIRAADTRGRLSVVADEIATPTYAEDLADALLSLVGTGLYGWYNMVNDGECSRLEYAQEIMRLTGRDSIEITPSALADYVRPAYTPPYSTLVNLVGREAGIALRPWQEALRDYVASYEF
jgi:dTDP-4-dehydrorhamnose reductase